MEANAVKQKNGVICENLNVLVNYLASQSRSIHSCSIAQLLSTIKEALESSRNEDEDE